MAKKQSETVRRGRDARTGEFIPIKEAERKPSTTVVERIPKPGKGRK